MSSNQEWFAIVGGSLWASKSVTSNVELEEWRAQIESIIASQDEQYGIRRIVRFVQKTGVGRSV